MRVALALVHHPVSNRLGELVTTAVTHLDVHDIARSCRSYDIARYFVVTPIEAQWRVVERILSHWTEGAGKRRVPQRGEALARVELVPSLGKAQARAEELFGAPPRTLATGAKPAPETPLCSYVEAREIANADAPLLLVFGTGHGLSEPALAQCQGSLPPIRPGGYNQLSVRAAVAITLDRVFGDGRVDEVQTPC
jgi:hypothetical protein